MISEDIKFFITPDKISSNIFAGFPSDDTAAEIIIENYFLHVYYNKAI